MPVVSSGQIRLNADVNVEINGSAGTNVSLTTLSTGASKTAPHGLQEFYGYTSMVAPSVTTSAISGVTVSNMTLNGNVTSDGGGTVTARGFYFGTSSNVTSNPQYGSGSGTGSFSLNRSVSASTTYYCAAYATNAAGTTVGPTVSATSQAAVPIGTYTSGTFEVHGHNGAAPSSSGQRVHARGYWQYNHPNYGFTNILYKESYMEWGGYGYGIPAGNNYYSGTYKKRTDTNAILQHRTYAWGRLFGANSNANFTGSGDISRVQRGCQYGTGSNYSASSTASWPSTLAGAAFSSSFGGGQIYWNFTGCCYHYQATGYVDTRN